MKPLLRNGLKGQKSHSPGHRPGGMDVSKFALQGQKPIRRIIAFALAGRWLRTIFTQGDAQGYWLVAPSGRCIAGRQHTHGSYWLVAPSGRCIACRQHTHESYWLVALSGRCINFHAHNKLIDDRKEVSD